MNQDGEPDPPDPAPAEDEVPVLGPENEIHDDEVGDLPVARILESDLPPSVEPEPPSVDSRNLRALYEERFRGLERDVRTALAHRAEGNELAALCYDPDPHVIAAVFENALAGLEHARIAALHHKNPVGLEFIVKRAPFLRDTQVQRALLKNDQLGESALRRMLTSKPLREVYKSAIDRDIPERNRVGSRHMLRARFAKAEPQERVEFIVATEARCLAVMVGATFDAKTTAMLCARQYNSALFVQNLARFSACPPQLLAHLLKQPFVQRNAGLKKALLQHPNMPTQAKRGV